MDKYRIDSHKLMYHVARVNDWLQNRLVYPIYLEVSPSGTCNHRCTFCAKDFMGYKNHFLVTDIFLKRLEEFGALGIKSIMYAGEGEPLLHPEIGTIIIHTKQQGIDVAITTNGVRLTPQLAKKMLPYCEWIKISINAGCADTYGRIHRTRPDDFDTVINNLAEAVAIRKKDQLSCTIGMQILLLPENKEEIVTLAHLAREVGVDYLVVKPFSQHHKSKNDTYKDIRYQNMLGLADELNTLNTDKFKVVFRANAMKKWDQDQMPHDRCQALPFWGYIDAKANVWGCSSFLQDNDFLYGNLHDQTFQEIWEGEKRNRMLQNNESVFSTSLCRTNCRMDEVNRYLWELKHPPAHVNFI